MDLHQAAMTMNPRRAYLKRSFLMATLVANLHGCAVELHHGTQVSQAQAKSFVIGATTFDEVVSSVGAPSWSATRPNGEKMIGYGRSTSRINPPSLETLAQGAPPTELVSVEMTIFVFDTSSRLIRVERAPGGQWPIADK